MSKLFIDGSTVLLTKQDVISLLEYSLNKKLFNEPSSTEYLVTDVTKTSGKFLLKVELGGDNG